jgi:hypothetical protein
LATARDHYSALAPKRGIQLQLGVIYSDRVLGLLTQTTGQPDEAAEHFEEALTFCRRAVYWPELAWTLCDYADAWSTVTARATKLRLFPCLMRLCPFLKDWAWDP